MDPNVLNSDHPPSRSTILDLALQIGLIALLVYACSRFISPFIDLLLWSAILAVMLYPLHLRLAVRLGNRWSALLIGLVGVTVMLVAMVTVVTSIASSLYSLIVGLHNQSLTVPPPPPWLAELPLVGHKLTETWVLVATNMPAAFAKYGGVLSAPAARLVSSAGGLAAGQLSFVLSFAIAAVLVAYGKGAADFARRLLGLFTGSEAQGSPSAYADGLYDPWRGARRCRRSGNPVASPRSRLLRHWSSGSRPLDSRYAFVCIVQVPAVLVTLPIIVYVFATKATQPAIIFLVWTLVAGLSDNVLKPLMLGRGLEVPMPVILIGVIGGMIADGLLGLFVGPVVLAVGYVLLIEWMRQRRAQSGPQTVDRTP